MDDGLQGAEGLPAPDKRPGDRATEAPRRLADLRVLLLILVLLAFCPLLAMALGNAIMERSAAAEAVFQDALSAMRLIAHAPEQASQHAQRLLAVLALAPEIRGRDAQACDAIFADILQNNPEFADVLAMTPDGLVFSSGSQQARDIRRLYLPLLVDRNPAAEFSWVGNLEGRSIVLFVHPVKGPGQETVALLAMVLDLSAYGRTFEKANLPPGSSLAMAKSDGTLLYHSRATMGWSVGNLAGEQFTLFKDLLSRGEEANATGTGMDGVERLYSVKRLHIGRGVEDLYVRVGIPLRAIYADVDRRLWRNLLGLGVTGALVLLLTWLYGNRFILNRVGRLMEAAQRIRQGDLSARSGMAGDNGPFGELAASFDAMAAALAEREEERQMHMAVLQEKDSRIQALFNATTDSVALLDPDGVILAANEIAARRRKATPQEMVGTRIFDSLPLEVAELRRLKVEKTARTGQPHVFDEEVGDRIYRVRLFPVVGSDGKTTRLASFSRDITERRLAERELVKAKRQAEAANEAKTQFLANMSHELRTPLNGILGMIQLLMTSELDEDQAQSLELARQSADNLHKIVNNLLEMASIEAGDVEIVNRAFGLAEVVDPLMRTFSVQARLKGLDLGLDIADDLPPQVIGDPFRLRQVLANLLSNALRYTPEGSVRVELRQSADQSGLPDPGMLRLAGAVTDTGIGIPLEAQRHIFESFELAEHYLNKRYSGSGLGLSIARQIVERMGGSIRVQSSPGQGSRFEFSVLVSLPGQDQAGRTPPSPDLRPRRKNSLRILLAEDELVNRMFASQVLGRMDHSVTAVTNGEEVLQALARESFDLILMDVQMPVMDGISATKAIRDGHSACKNPSIPIVALTAYALESDRDRFLKVGMDDFVAKPFTVEALSQAIDRALSR
jgi:PAS domain S-box-containing protein